MSLDLADRNVFYPVAFIPVLKHNILRRFNAASENNPFVAYYNDWVSDHLPVSLKLVRNKKPFFSTAQTPTLEEIITVKYGKYYLPKRTVSSKYNRVLG